MEAHSRIANFENIRFQLIDTPPVPTEFIDPGLTDLLRRTDIIVAVLDIQADPLQQMEDTMAFLNGLRIYQPGAPIPADLKKAPFIKNVLLAVNKVDDESAERDYRAFQELCDLPLPSIPISILAGYNLSKFLRKIYEMAGVIRVYTKSPGKEPDLNYPSFSQREHA